MHNIVKADAILKFKNQDIIPNTYTVTGGVNHF